MRKLWAYRCLVTARMDGKDMQLWVAVMAPDLTSACLRAIDAANATPATEWAESEYAAERDGRAHCRTAERLGKAVRA